MSDLERTMAASASGMAAQAARIRLTTENIANADTPGYRRKTVSFEETFDARPRHPGGGDRAGASSTGASSCGSTIRATRWPGRTAATSGSNVDLVVEIADAREANRSYEANLKMFDQARQMASSLLGLLRR